MKFHIVINQWNEGNLTKIYARKSQLNPMQTVVCWERNLNALGLNIHISITVTAMTLKFHDFSQKYIGSMERKKQWKIFEKKSYRVFLDTDWHWISIKIKINKTNKTNKNISIKINLFINIITEQHEIMRKYCFESKFFWLLASQWRHSLLS